MKKSYAILCGLIVALTCTQCSKDTLAEAYKDVTIAFSKTPIPADSFSSAEVTIKYGKELKRDQQVVVTTSHGVLYAPPYQFDQPGQKSIVLTPFSDQSKLLLVASTMDVADPVYVSVNLEGFIKGSTCTFDCAYPDNFEFEAPVNIINTTVNFELPLVFSKKQYRISNGLECNVSWKHTKVSSATDSILLVIPTMVRTQNGKAAVPVRIPKYVAGDQVTVTATTRLANNPSVSRSCLLIFE